MLIFRALGEDWKHAVDEGEAVVVLYGEEPPDDSLAELARVAVPQVEFFAFIGPRSEQVHDRFDRYVIDRLRALEPRESKTVPMTAWTESGSFEEGARLLQEEFRDAMSFVGDLVVIAPEEARRFVEMHELLRGVESCDEMRGESDVETTELRVLLDRARAYLLGHRWCRAIIEERFGMGVGGIVAVFLFRIEPAGDEDEWLWVVCGDLPSAYLVTDEAPTPAEALARYCDLMDDWIEAVRTNGDLAAVFPVAAEPTLEHAQVLAVRIAFLRVELLGETTSQPEAPSCE